jgi:hypothetical protein
VPFGSNLRLTFILGTNLGVDFEHTSNALGTAVSYNYIANGRQAGTYTADMPCEEKETDDYKYVKTQYGVVLKWYQGSGNRIRVPAEIDGAAVKALVMSFSSKGIVNLMIPEGITCIGDIAFNNNQLTSVPIPASVTYIGDNAFGSNQLTSVTIPQGVTNIGKSAFSGNKLTSVTIPASVTYIGSSAFGMVETLVIGANVEIGSDIFEVFYDKIWKESGAVYLRRGA